MKKKLNCVLLIEDDKILNYFNRWLLTKMDIAEKIEIAENGQVALDFLSNGGRFHMNEGDYPRPKLIFLDLNMPLMNGWQFLEEYHKLPEEQKGKIVFIMLTSSPNREDADHAKSNKGVAGFVKKPLLRDALEKIIANYFPEID